MERAGRQYLLSFRDQKIKGTHAFSRLGVRSQFSQFSERMEGGKTAKVTSEHKLAQGTSGAATVSTSGASDRQRYQTRVLSSANKVNLEFAEAEPELIKGLTTAISGMF